MLVCGRADIIPEPCTILVLSAGRYMTVSGRARGFEKPVEAIHLVDVFERSDRSREVYGKGEEGGENDGLHYCGERGVC